jgi:hypothetical protein
MVIKKNNVTLQLSLPAIWALNLKATQNLQDISLFPKSSETNVWAASF